jgi:hypothetical protein
MSTRDASQDWHFEPESWAARERLIYRARAAFMRFELVWELEKSVKTGEATIRVRGSMRVPLKKEQRLTWRTDAAAFPENQGFGFLEELDPQRARTRKWVARADSIGFAEISGGEQTESLALAGLPGVRIFNAFQVPALLRAALASGAGSILVVVVSRRYYAVRARDLGAASDNRQKIRLEAAPVPGADLRSVDWDLARSAEIDWDVKTGIAREIRIKAPVVGVLRIMLEKHETSKV